MLDLYPNGKHMSIFFPLLFMKEQYWYLNKSCVFKETQSRAFSVTYWSSSPSKPSLGPKGTWVMGPAPKVEVFILQDELLTEFHQISIGLGWSEAVEDQEKRKKLLFLPPNRTGFGQTHQPKAPKLFPQCLMLALMKMLLLNPCL